MIRSKQACPCCSTPRQLAEGIAAELMESGGGEIASRLQLMGGSNGDRNLGGWCRKAVVDVIARALGEHPNCKIIAAKLAAESKAKRVLEPKPVGKVK